MTRSHGEPYQSLEETYTPAWGDRTFIDPNDYIPDHRWFDGIELSPITFNEVHAFSMGLSGILIGLADQPAIAVALVVGALLFPPEREDPIGRRTISAEPWYFVVALCVSYMVGMIILMLI